MHLKKAIESLIQRKSLTHDQSLSIIEEMVQGGNPHQMAAFLALLKAKGETVDEVLGIVHAMQSHMDTLEIPGPLIDIVGTGGDNFHSVNISTGAALLTAACGAKVVKHGSRASSSKCGSADVLEKLGVSLDGDPSEDVKAHGITFLFAQKYHPAMKNIAPVRKSLGVRTIFNLIGPLLNPANPEYMLLGVANEKLLELFASVLQQLGVKRCLVVFGNGMDEITPTGVCSVIEVTPKEMHRFKLDPEKLGFSRCKKEDLRGGDVETNATLLKEALSGKEGPIADTLILNAGVALYICGMVHTMEEGIILAKAAHKEGKGLKLLEEWSKK